MRAAPSAGHLAHPVRRLVRVGAPGGERERVGRGRGLRGVGAFWRRVRRVVQRVEGVRLPVDEAARGRVLKRPAQRACGQGLLGGREGVVCRYVGRGDSGEGVRRAECEVVQI